MRVFVLSLVALGVGAGCAFPGDSGGETSAELEQEQAALISVERHEGGSHVAARYVRSVRLDADILRATGGSFELPPLGQCSALGAIEAHPLEPIELFAAGATKIAQGDRLTELSPRSIPDVSDVISGVVYSTNTPLAAGPTTLQLAGLGESLSFDIPTEISQLELDDQSLSGVQVELAEGSHSVRLRWQREMNDDGAERSVVVDVLHTQGSLRCHLADNGNAELERALFGDEGSLIVRRVALTELELEAFARISIVAESSRTVSYRIR